MSKSLFYRLFGLGKVPKKMRPILEGEGIVLEDEGLPGSMTFRNYRAPGRYSGYRRNWFAGALVVTKLRIVAFAFWQPVVNIALKDEKLDSLDCEVEREETLRLGFDAAVFDERASGSIELRFKTPRSRMFLDWIEEGRR